ncbi:hypothetical protein LOK49_LG05G01074 [Camellia lanceoleosa]|uniref:Uncharacterized protein n=1 Tax=Camellia lanceoleosa TaxID=1840588 RepID=A0ACC0HSS3_9ERIC|nr:hypothetical protein LOK49_LG05G01074 [Camellia lanceoleosa]
MLHVSESMCFIKSYIFVSLSQEAEKHLSEMVVSKALVTKIDRPMGIVCFQATKDNNDILNSWAMNLEKLLDLVEKSCHQIHKETMVHKAALKLKSEDSELDFEFLGNRKGKPIRVQTNVFLKGKGNREQRIHIWFENTKTSKLKMISLLKSQSVRVLTYFVNRLSPQQLFCDEYLIRVFKNNRRNGVGFPTQPMQLMATIWDGDSWATNGEKTKIIWAHAPFDWFLIFPLFSSSVLLTATYVPCCNSCAVVAVGGVRRRRDGGDDTMVEAERQWREGRGRERSLRTESLRPEKLERRSEAARRWRGLDGGEEGEEERDL